MDIHNIIPPQLFENKEVSLIRECYNNSHQFEKYAIPKIDENSDIVNAIIYNDSDNQSYHPIIKKSYDSFIYHLIQQYELLVKYGYKFYSSQEEYSNSHEMLADVYKNKQLFYLSTHATNSITEDHLMSQLTHCIDDNNNVMTAHEVFKCVHDVFAHSAGYNFSFLGEKGAWLIHRNSLPKVAHLALWNETHGQNSWTNAGPHMRTSDNNGFYRILNKNDPQYITAKDRPFPLQKSVMVPEKYI